MNVHSFPYCYLLVSSNSIYILSFLIIPINDIPGLQVAGSVDNLVPKRSKKKKIEFYNNLEGFQFYHKFGFQYDTVPR